MDLRNFGKLALFAACIGVAVNSQAQPARRGYSYGQVAHFDWGRSDDKPRFSDPKAIYLWHEDYTFYIAIGPEQRGSIYVRADVLRGSITDATHRVMDDWGRGERRWDSRARGGNWDNAGVNHVSNDIIEYSAQGGTWDIVRFDVRNGENIRFNFDPEHNGRNHRTIFIGGEMNRKTKAETIEISLPRRRR